ncbi:uncharacterized protein L201_007390 [Kwoniella dendrophila CBS 6074]|uniref:Uncharacterized protein n=1 Tax=Kwoniella dendrophila CBS 6074 TaxID=1295534 RepID=A0AAX4K492_9TREE
MWGTTPPMNPTALPAVSGSHNGNGGMMGMGMSGYEQPINQGHTSTYGGVGFGLGGSGSGGMMNQGAGGGQAFPSMRNMPMGMGGMSGMGGMGGMPGMNMGMGGMGIGMPGMGMGGMGPGMGMGGMAGFPNGLVYFPLSQIQFRFFPRIVNNNLVFE